MSTEDKEIRLVLWSEVIGMFGGCFSDNHFIRLKINEKLLAFPKESKEAEVILKKLDDSLLGKWIGILKTDLPKKSLVIRVLK